MKRKEILDFIRKQGQTSVVDILNIFGANTSTGRKKVKRILSDYSKSGKIKYNTHNGMLEIVKKQEKQSLKKKKKSLSRGIVNEENNIREADPAETDFNKVVEKYKVRSCFKRNVLREVESLSEAISDEEISARVDLRDTYIVTIDGADAKDLDDAISIEKTEDGWRLGVHIADVSHYVPKGSYADHEAFRRANSFYFINRVVPMFPEALSNGLCSLNTGKDKLTLSVFVKVSKDGQVGDFEFFSSVIHTCHRLTYSGVQAILDGVEKPQDPKLIPFIRELYSLMKVLYRKRMADGGIDFNFRELKIILDEKDEPVQIWQKDRLDSERMIEECMLVANRSVASYLSEHGVSLYRIHEEPDAEKMQNFIRVALKFGYQLRGTPVPDPIELQTLLHGVRNEEHSGLINQVLLRSMQQARYDTDNRGHYGLGFDYYTHFTSPIRRYADLVVHRLLKGVAKGKRISEIYSKRELDTIAEHISTVERVAVEAERAIRKMKSVRFMKDKVGKVYDGVITGIIEHGMFVQIELFGIEGFLAFMDMEDYYTGIPEEFAAKGSRNGRIYTMGDKIKVQVKKVNLRKFYLDFKLVED